MDDNIWEYPFGDLDDDEDIYYRKPAASGGRTIIYKIISAQPVRRPFHF